MRQKTRFYSHFDCLVPLEELAELSTYASCDAPRSKSVLLHFDTASMIPAQVAWSTATSPRTATT
jgi:hypothetical protein